MGSRQTGITYLHVGLVGECASCVRAPADAGLHSGSELAVVRGGCALYHTDQEEHAIGKGDVLFIPAGREHTYLEARHLDLVSVLFEPSFCIRQAPEIQALPGGCALSGLNDRNYGPRADAPAWVHLDPKGQAHVAEILDHLREACEEGNPSSGAEARAWFTLLVVYLARRWPAAPKVSLVRNVSLARALDHIEAHYMEALTPESLARAACVSKSTLQRIFREHLKTTPMEYTMESRIEHGRQLILNTGLSVGLIAERVGFSDSNHFSRRFKQSYHVSPLEYRRRHAL